jgi:hypothetical protein
VTRSSTASMLPVAGLGTGRDGIPTQESETPLPAAGNDTGAEGEGRWDSGARRGGPRADASPDAPPTDAFRPPSPCGIRCREVGSIPA